MNAFAVEVSRLLGATLYQASGWEALREEGPWLLVLSLAVLLAVGAAIWGSLRERALAPRGGVALLALRAIAIAAAVVLLVAPTRRDTVEVETPSQVVVLLDYSASMAMPSAPPPESPTPRSAAADEAASRVDAILAPVHNVRIARFGQGIEYDDGPRASIEDAPAESATRLGVALRRVLADHAASPLAAIVVASDGGWNAGPDPAGAAEAAAAVGVPIHTLGVGPLTEAPSIGLRDLAAPTRAALGDRFRVTVSVVAGAGGASVSHRVDFSLAPVTGEDAAPADAVWTEQLDVTVDPGETATATAEVEAPRTGRFRLAAELTPATPDADPADNKLDTIVEVVDEPTRVLLAAGGPGRDYRFLRNQLFRDDQFVVDVHLQSASGAVTQDAERVIADLPKTADELADYDAVVVIDVDWRRVDEDSVAALADWVATRGGGLVFVAGPVATPACVRAGLPGALARLLPVTLRDDPLASLAGGAARQPLPVRPTSAGETVDHVRSSSFDEADQTAWRRLPGFFATGPPATAKPAATTLAIMGEERRAPLLVEHFYGAGRCVYVATAETWRLRMVDPAWFTALHTGLLRRVSEGRLAASEAIGALVFDRPRYDVGSVMSLRFVRRAAPTEEGTPVARVRLPDRLVDVELSPTGEQALVAAAQLEASAVGAVEAILTTPTGETLRATTEVLLPSLEAQSKTQNAALLRRIAAQSGGEYVDVTPGGVEVAAALEGLAADIPSKAETQVELGPIDEEFSRTVATASLTVLAVSLLLEWTLRRFWRLA